MYIFLISLFAIFLHSWFGKQNVNESLIHKTRSQQDTNRQKHPQKNARQTTRNDSELEFDL